MEYLEKILTMWDDGISEPKEIVLFLVLAILMLIPVYNKFNKMLH